MIPLTFSPSKWPDFHALIGTLLSLICLNHPCLGQLDQAYFQKLQQEQVPSTNLVEWRQVGPGMAGYCEEFWCHPTLPNVLMMSPDMFNTYGSWDGGNSWQSVKDVDGSGRDLARIRKFTFSHQNPAYGLCISGRGKLYKTEDTGKSWTEIRKFKGYFAELTVDPSNDHVWYLGPGDFWNVKKKSSPSEGTNQRGKK